MKCSGETEILHELVHDTSRKVMNQFAYHEQLYRPLMSIAAGVKITHKRDSLARLRRAKVNGRV